MISSNWETQHHFILSEQACTQFFCGFWTPLEMHLLIIHKGKTRRDHGGSSPSTVPLNSPHKMPARRTIFQYPLWEPLRHPHAPATNHSSKFVFTKTLSSFLSLLIIYRHAEIYNECIPIADRQFFAKVWFLDKPKCLWLHPHVAYTRPVGSSFIMVRPTDAGNSCTSEIFPRV